MVVETCTKSINHRQNSKLRYDQRKSTIALQFCGYNSEILLICSSGGIPNFPASADNFEAVNDKWHSESYEFYGLREAQLEWIEVDSRLMEWSTKSAVVQWCSGAVMQCAGYAGAATKEPE